MVETTKTINDYNEATQNFLNSYAQFTMSDMSRMSDIMSDIMRRSNTLKYKHWRIRLIWKDMFNIAAGHGFDNAYTENIFNVFKKAVSYSINNMSEDETTRFINTIIKTMREV